MLEGRMNAQVVVCADHLSQQDFGKAEKKANHQQKDCRTP
jgi:hypothetical protein